MTAEIQVTNTNEVTETLKSTIMAKIPANQYNAYVHQFTSDLVLGNEKASTIIVSDSTTGDSLRTNFVSKALSSRNALYSTCMLLEADLMMEINNVKTKENWQALVSSVVHDPIPDVANPKFSYKYDNNEAAPAEIYQIPILPTNGYITFEGGNGNPLCQPLTGPVCNVLNAQMRTIEIVIGDNSVASQITYDYPKVVENEMRKLEKEYVLNHYDGALIPSMSGNKQYVVPELVYNEIKLSTSKSESIVHNLWTLRPEKKSYNSPFPTLHDLEMDPFNALSSRNRGQIFKKNGVVFGNKAGIEGASKSVESPNFILNLVTGQVDYVKENGTEISTTAVNSKKLYNCIDKDGYIFFSNFANCQEAYNKGYSRCSLEWKTNGLIRVDHIYLDADKLFDYDFKTEPRGQRLNVCIRIPKMVSPVCHPLLSFDHRAVFCNAGNLMMQLTRHAKYNELIETNFKFDQEIGNNTGDISVTITSQNNQLRLNQYQNTILNPYVNEDCVIPYLNIKNSTTKVLKYTTKQVQTYRFNFDTLTEIAKYLNAFGNKPGAIFKALRIYINNNSDVFTNISMVELYNATKRNGINIYTQFDNKESGYPNLYKKVYNPPPENKRATPNNWGQGSILLLNYGVDIPMQNPNLMAGLGRVNLTYTVELDVEYDPVFGEDLAITINHLFQSYYVISGSNSNIINYSYDSRDVNLAYEKMIADVSSGTLYEHVRKFFGGAVEMASKHIAKMGKKYKPEEKKKPTLNAVNNNVSRSKQTLGNMIGWK